MFIFPEEQIEEILKYIDNRVMSFVKSICKLSGVF